jgi:energy-coupling factor transport system permease protein
VSGLLSFYGYRDSRIHRLDPRVKALWVIFGVLVIFSTDDWRMMLALATVNVLLTVAARIELRALAPMLQVLALFGAVILVFQLLFQRGPVFAAIGPLGLHTAGLVITREVWLRLANLSLLFAQFIMWTHPTDIALMWLSLGVPYRYAMLGALAVRFFPIFQGEVGRIQDAQRVRGRALHTTAQRIAGLVTVVLPFVLRVLKRTNDVAVAMELRGYGYARTRTFARALAMRPVDWAVAAVLIAAVGARIVAIAGRP